MSDRCDKKKLKGGLKEDILNAACVANRSLEVCIKSSDIKVPLLPQQSKILISPEKCSRY